MSLESMCEGIPDEFVKYMRHVKNLDFAGAPNY
jgi:hypothetical protein